LWTTHQCLRWSCQIFICQLADQAQAHSFGHLVVMSTPSYLIPFPAAVIHSYWCLRSTVGSVALKISKSKNEITFISQITDSAYLSLVKVCPTTGGSRMKVSRKLHLPQSNTFQTESLAASAPLQQVHALSPLVYGCTSSSAKIKNQIACSENRPRSLFNSVQLALNTGHDFATHWMEVELLQKLIVQRLRSWYRRSPDETEKPWFTMPWSLDSFQTETLQNCWGAPWKTSYVTYPNMSW
jgi:hypothetical protein